MLQQIDNAALEFFGKTQIVGLNEFMIFISFLGNAGWIWIVTALILLCFKKTRRGGFSIAIALIIGLIICNLTLKPLVARVRPFDANDINLLIPPPSDWSFPSGHTCSSFAAAIAAGLALKGRAWLFIIPASLIAISRLYLQVHYLTDVLAGAAIGALAAIIAYYLLKLIDAKLKN